MTNKNLKDFRNAIHKNLRIDPQKNSSSCFIVKEESQDSAIEKIEFTFKNQDNVLIIRQKENRDTINILKEFSTNCSCDFIVLMIDKTKEIRIYFCEIKSSCKEKYLKEAYEQILSSKLFLKYVMDCYSYYTQNNDFKDFDIESVAKYYYIYPKIGISSKQKISNGLILKPLEIHNKIAKIFESDIYNFFGI